MATTCKSLVPVLPPLFTRIMSFFPKEYFRYCFAYGSGVFKQKGQTSEPMIDMIFVVDDSVGFHGSNMLLNPDHYSDIKRLGHRFVTFIQEKWPAYVYFNTLIPIKEENVVIKYGVISTADFIDDLLDWNALYVSGRLHKPVLELRTCPTKQLNDALYVNIFSAIHATLLILPEYFTERHFYRTLVSLSYNGDFRMAFGEDKNKIENIVNAQIDHFQKLYRPLLSTMKDYLDVPYSESADQTCVQDMSPDARMYHLFQLPKIPQQSLAREWRMKSLTVGGRKRDTEEIMTTIAHDPDLITTLLAKCLRRIVFKSSVLQSFKGIVSAGFMKSFRYSNQKITKMLKSQEPTR